MGPRRAPRRGRQPAAPSASRRQHQQPRHSKASAGAASGSKSTGKGKRSKDDEDNVLDVYSYSNSTSASRKRQHLQAAESSRKSSSSSSSKRARLDAAEDDQEGSTDDDDDDDDESGDDFFAGGKKPAFRLIGVDSDDDGKDGDEDGDGDQEVAAEDEDEEIDSDLAGGSSSDDDSDEEDERPKRGAEKRVRWRKGEIDLRERDSSDDDDDDDDEDMVDASALLDDDSEPDGGQGGGAGMQDDDDDDEEEDGESEDEEEGGLDKLNSFITGLDARADDDRDAANKRARFEHQTEALPEGEFAAVGAQSGKVELADLLGAFADSDDPKLASLKKTLKPLAARPRRDVQQGAKTPKSILKSDGPLSAPLPGRLQDKLAREAAYAATKQEADKWNDTVRLTRGGARPSGDAQARRDADSARKRVLHLPLEQGGGQANQATAGPSARAWNAKFEPSTDVELAIASLLDGAQMSTQQDVSRHEDDELARASITPEELAARRAALRKQRDLLFEAERKAKRVARIKSKAFRRIHRRQGRKEQLSLDEMRELDEIDGGDRVSRERERLETQRARERATLKHSTKGSSRWASKAGEIAGLDDERNRAVRDMVQREEVLRRKISGVDSDASSDSGPDDSDSGDDDLDESEVRRRAHDRALDEIAAFEAKEAAKRDGAPAKGVMGMKFMRDAQARARQEAQAEVDDLDRTLGRADANGDEEQENGDRLYGNIGRMVFGPTPTVASTAAAADDDSDDEDHGDGIIDGSLPKPHSRKHSTKTQGSVATSSKPAAASESAREQQEQEEQEEEENPWLALGAGASGKRARKSEAPAKSSAEVRFDKAKERVARDAGVQDDDARVDFDATATLHAAEASAENDEEDKAKSNAARNRRKRERRRQKLTGTAVAPAASGADNDDGDESSGDDLEANEANKKRRKQGRKAVPEFAQRELVAEAFAGDDVVAEFEAAKKAEVERDAPHDVDVTLPGWGAWAGRGVRKPKRPARRHVQHVPGIDERERQDAGKAHVIISERKDRKASKYLVPDLPHPFTGTREFDRHLAVPLGPEWATAVTMREQTMPSVVTKPGVAIRPVSHRI